jgi:hypothetical protein
MSQHVRPRSFHYIHNMPGSTAQVMRDAAVFQMRQGFAGGIQQVTAGLTMLT